jgi:hypothetical protein
MIYEKAKGPEVAASEPSAATEAATYTPNSTLPAALAQPARFRYRLPEIRNGLGGCVGGEMPHYGPNAALVYYTAGLRVLPLFPEGTQNADGQDIGKMPARSGFDHTQPDACWQPEEFQLNEGAAILCGPCPAGKLRNRRLLGLDLDKAMDRPALEALIGALPDTLTSKGWRHAYYWIPEDSPLRQGNGVLRVPGGALDIRPAAGGYLAERGNWDGTFDPSRIVDLPEAAHRALIGAQGQRELSTPAAVIASAKQLSEGDARAIQLLASVSQRRTPGDKFLGALGGVLYRTGISRDRAESIGIGWAEATESTHPNPGGRVTQAYDGKHGLGWPALRAALEQDGGHIGGDSLFDSIEVKVNDVLSEIEELLTASVDAPEVVESPDEPAQSAAPRETPASERSTPVAPAAERATGFPMHAMPAAAREFIEGAQEQFRASRDLIAQAVLGAMSAAVQGNVAVRAEYLVPTSLYLLTAAPPGESKSPVFKAAFAPIKAWEKARVAAERGTLAKARTERKALEKRYAAAEKQLGECEKEEVSAMARGCRNADTLRAESRSPELRNELTGLSLALAAPEPREYRYFVSDATPAALVDLFAVFPRLACVDDEGHEVFETIIGRRFSKAGGGPASDLNVILKAYDSDAVQVDRSSREVKRAERACLSISLAVQPEVLWRATNDRDLLARGLLDRFCFVVLGDSGPRLRAPDDIPAKMLDYVASDYAAMIGRMVDVPEGTELEMTPDARALFNRHKFESERREDLKELRGWNTKHTWRAVRLAGILAVAKGERKVTAETLGNAVEICEWWAGQALRAFSVVPELETVHQVVAWIKERGGKVTGRELMPRFKKLFPTKKAIEEFAHVSAAAGLLRYDRTPRGAYTFEAA